MLAPRSNHPRACASSLPSPAIPVAVKSPRHLEATMLPSRAAILNRSLALPRRSSSFQPLETSSPALSTMSTTSYVR